MPNAFPYDVFLSHSAKDKAAVRPLAERLRKDGVKVWPVPPKRFREGGFDEWVLKPGDSIPSMIEDGLEHSRVLAGPAEASARRRMLCMSANAFGSDWAQLACPAIAAKRRRKAGTFRFRDLLNRERCFLPLRLDKCACPKGASASSPRLAHRAYLGFTNAIWKQPQRGLWWSSRAIHKNEMAQPRCG